MTPPASGRAHPVRAYSPGDEATLISLWSAALPYDPIDARTFHRKVLLDPNFDPDWLLLAERGTEPFSPDVGEKGSVPLSAAGFCLCVIRRVPLVGLDLQPERGWITAFGVHPVARRMGIGSALLDRALELFRQAGRKEVLIAPYTPNYLMPGVDVDRYADGLEFLRKRGFEVTSRPLSMDANIVLFDYGPYAGREAHLREQAVEVRPLQPHEVPALLGFLAAHMPGDWVRHAREVLVDATKGLAEYDQFVVAQKDNEVVGYCQFEGEHFGPFGVRSDLQGRGIGTVLLAKCLRVMQSKGLHNAWVLWTSDEAADRVYSKFGFRETRRFGVMRRGL